PALGSAADRKSWIRFEDRPDGDVGAVDEFKVEMPSPESSGCATIQPTDSIQINATNDYTKRCASPSSPSTHISIGLPLNQSNHTMDANIMSNIESNKVMDKSFIKNNNNNDIHATSGETSHESNVKTLQTRSIMAPTMASALILPTLVITTLAAILIELVANGDVIVTLLPVNDHCAWLTPAIFKPELVPEELMAQSLSLTVEDYVSAIQVLVNDLRFNLYITLYKRMLVMWIALGFIILLSLLFSGIKGLPLFVGGVIWLVINVFGIFATMYLKVKPFMQYLYYNPIQKLYHLLERCISQVNGMLYKYNILLGVDDRGSLSCHKINLIFIYFDVKYCIKFLNDMLENETLATNGQLSTTSTIISRMDINTSDITITGTQPKSVSQKEKYAEKLLLRYSQRWVKDFVRRKIDLNMPLHADSAGVSVAPLPTTHRHCTTSRCLCQFIEEHLKFKPLTQCNITELFM
ncbi:unnamed protein product, partial [Oppiella nova]